MRTVVREAALSPAIHTEHTVRLYTLSTHVAQSPSRPAPGVERGQSDHGVQLLQHRVPTIWPRSPQLPHNRNRRCLASERCASSPLVVYSSYSHLIQPLIPQMLVRALSAHRC